MTNNIILLPILIPLAAAVLTLVIPNTPPRWNSRYQQLHRGGVAFIALISTAATLVIAALLFRKNINFSVPWAGFGFEFSLRCYNFSSFIMLAASFFGFLIALYSSTFLNNKSYAKYFYAYFLITLSFVNGTVLAENLVLLLFFWEG